jgi:uncharacterized membrane protein YqgA involved in biofilm formation
MEQKTIKVLIIACVLMFILGASIGYMINIEENTEKIMEQINNKYDCKERNNFSTIKGENIYATTNNINNNNS